MNFTELGNEARLTLMVKGCHGDVLTAHGRIKWDFNLSRLEALDLG